jgi:dolichyl-diphosphooligosaccharide--protein glycosyltransferase
VSRAAFWIGLALAALLAWTLRTWTRAGYESPPDATGAGGPAWQVDDPDAAYHLRRAQIALVSGEVPARDRFLAHPGGSAVPWPPLFDGLLALVARQIAPATPGAAAALDDAAEARIEAALVFVPAILGTLSVLAVAWAAWVLGRGLDARPRGAAALAAAAIQAATPIAVWYTELTRVDHAALVVLLEAVLIALAGWVLTTEVELDRTLGSICAGLAAGAALLAWLPSSLIVLGCGAAFALAAVRAGAERGRESARVGLLFFLAAALATAVPAASSPWNALQPGSLVNLTEGVPRSLVAAALPFAVLALFGRTRLARWKQMLLALAVLAAAVALLPGFTTGVREGFDWASRANLFMDVVEESQPLLAPARGAWWSAALRDHGLVLALLVPALVLSARRLLAPERFLVWTLALGFLALTLTQRRFGDTLVVPAAIVIPLACAERAERAAAAGRAGARRGWIVGLGCAGLAGLAGAIPVFSVGRDVLADTRAWRAEIVAGLRWMRAETPASGPWNVPDARQDYGVLAHWGLGHLIEYHARRPVIATNFGSFVGADGFESAAAALLEDDPQELARRMRALGARYLVVTPRLASDLGSLARIAGWSDAERAALFERGEHGKSFSPRASACAALALALDRAGAAPDWPGLTRVHAASRRETLQGRPPRAGEPAGPVIAIWELADGAGEARAEIVPAASGG